MERVFENDNNRLVELDAEGNPVPGHSWSKAFLINQQQSVAANLQAAIAAVYDDEQVRTAAIAARQSEVDEVALLLAQCDVHEVTL